jgi:hypothetical protein
MRSVFFKAPFKAPFPSSTSFPGLYPNPYIRTRGPGRRLGTIEVSRDDPGRQVCPHTTGWISCQSQCVPAIANPRSRRNHFNGFCCENLYMRIFSQQSKNWIVVRFFFTTEPLRVSVVKHSRRTAPLRRVGNIKHQPVCEKKSLCIFRVVVRLPVALCASPWQAVSLRFTTIQKNEL